jgi:sodium transport system permease protein
VSRITQLLVVTRKELRDAVRDRRAVYSVLLGSLFGPALIGIMFNAIADRQRELRDLTLPIVGIEHAPALIDWLRQQDGVTVVPGPADAEAAVRDRTEDVVVIIPDDYEKTFGASRPVEIKIVSDGSRNTARPKAQRARALLQGYASQIAALRLVGRGVSPVVVMPLQLRDLEVSSAQQRAAQILNFIPMFIVLAAFTGGMQIATDSTAGERERGSLEALLVNPAPRGVIVGGKWLAAGLSAALSVAITTTLCVLLLRFIPMADLGLRFRLGPAQVFWMLSAVLPMCLLSTSIQLYLSTFARSFKEAQTYMGYLVMATTAPAVLSSVYPIASKPWMYPVPIIGQHLLAVDVLGGKVPGPWLFLVSAVAVLTAAAVLVWLTTSNLRREKVIFAR